MHSSINVIEFPPRDLTGDARRFFAWRWARGAITIMIEGLDEETGGEAIIGEPTLVL